MLASAAIEALNIIEQKPGKNYFFTSAVILLPLRPASLALKNPQRCRIIHGMHPEGYKEVE